MCIHVIEALVVSWISSLEMNRATWVQTLNEAVCISHSTNTLWKIMNPTFLPPAMGKIVGQTGILSLGLKENWIHTSKNPHKKIDLVSYPGHMEGLVNTYKC